MVVGLELCWLVAGWLKCWLDITHKICGWAEHLAFFLWRERLFRFIPCVVFCCPWFECFRWTGLSTRGEILGYSHAVYL